MEYRLMLLGARDAQSGTIKKGMPEPYYRAHRQQKEAMG